MGNKLREIFFPETKWLNKRITDADPCKDCSTHVEHYIKAVYGNPAERDEAAITCPEECKGCIKRITWEGECFAKLRWYENNDKSLK